MTAIDMEKFVDACSRNTGATAEQVRMAVKAFEDYEDYTNLPFGTHIVDVYCTVVDYLLNSGVGSKTSAVQEVGKRLGLDVVDVSISSSNTLTRKQ